MSVIGNMTSLYNFGVNSSHDGNLHDDDDDGFSTPREIIRYIISPIICIFGLLGNSLTLVVLTRKRLKSSCDGTERTVNVGLIALAVSDLCCCLAMLPHSFGRKEQEVFAYTSKSFYLVYKTYSHAVINTFFLTSTWLTVTMATSRYLAICHPFKARHLISLAGTRTSILLVFAVCVIFNIPRFLEYHIDDLTCYDGQRQRYFRKTWVDGPLAKHPNAMPVYVWLYFSIGICLPLAMLAFCNICLVRALRESSKLRRRYRVPAAHVDSNYRITSILVTIVVMYIVLVSPSEILRFMSKRANSSSGVWGTVVEVTNVLQAINFACDFVLYFVLNVHFRQAMKDLMWAIIQGPLRCLGIKSSNSRLGRPLKPQLSMSRHSTTNTFV